jgi:hypothetical protein
MMNTRIHRKPKAASHDSSFFLFFPCLEQQQHRLDTVWLRETTTERFQKINNSSSSGKISLSETASKSASNAMIADITKQKMEVNGTFFVACTNV